MILPSKILPLSQDQRDLLQVLQAAIAGRAPDAPPTDWDAVLSLARLQGVDFFLYSPVCSWDEPLRPPAPLMEKWRRLFFGAVVKHTHRSVQLSELFAALHAANVQVVPLKGCWLAEKVYEDGAGRPMCDIDLLVRPDRLKQALSALEKLGYVNHDADTPVERDKHMLLGHPERLAPVELHWRLWYPSQEFVRQMDPDWVFQGLAEDILLGERVEVFSVERHLVYLCQHIVGHGFAVPLRSYLDLTLLCRKFGRRLDMAVLDQEARSWGVAFGAKFILSVAFELAGEMPECFSTYLTGQELFLKERKDLLDSTLAAGGGPRMESPARAALHNRAWRQLLSIGLSRVFLSPNRLRASYPQAVRRFGLPGGVFARAVFLMRRRGRVRQMVVAKDPVETSYFDAYNTRRSLSEWICSQDTEEIAE